MKATEAAKLADVIKQPGEAPLFKDDGEWCMPDFDNVNFKKLTGDDWIPFVPLKQYKVGDQVTFLEALQSGRCFADNILVYKFEGNVFYYWCSAKKRWVECDTNLNRSSLYTYTIVAEPSVPPKPTIESLAPGTIFRSKWNSSPYECIRGWDRFYPNDGSNWGCNWVSLGDPGWTLTHIKRNDEWEEV